MKRLRPRFLSVKERHESKNDRDCEHTYTPIFNEKTKKSWLKAIDAGTNGPKGDVFDPPKDEFFKKRSAIRGKRHETLLVRLRGEP